MKTTVAAALAAVALTAGCTTMMEQRRAEQARELTEQDALRKDVAQLKDLVRELAASRQRMLDEMDASRRQTETSVRDLGLRVAQLEQALRALEGRQSQNKTEIVEHLSRTMKDMLAQQAPKPAKPAFVQGREHKVEPGQTLSEIASAYGVKVADIVKANNLKDANSVRVGQVIFIPQ